MKQRFNKFPNRAKRREFAKKKGVFKHPGLWKAMNKGVENVQTIIKEKRDKNR